MAGRAEGSGVSWTQGIQLREELPERFLAWADKQKGGAPLQYITWFDLGDEVFLDYGDAGSITVTLRENPK